MRKFHFKTQIVKDIFVVHKLILFSDSELTSSISAIWMIYDAKYPANTAFLR